MPCDIGYRSVARTRIPQPKPQVFKERVKPPEVDQNLLAKIGAEDSPFAEWLEELDINPLLQEALRLTLARIRNVEGLEFAIQENGYLEISGTYLDSVKKSQFEKASKDISVQFQIEVMKMVAELLGYETSSITEEKGEFFFVGEGEQPGEVHRYLRVSLNTQGEGALKFEHFDSPSSLEKESIKFLALAQKLGVKIIHTVVHSSGQPIASGTVHQHFLHEGESNNG